MTASEYRAGYVAVVGRPNVGKSTLLNRLVGQRISITSRKPQTTRYCISGIVTTKAAQIVLVDTPGFQLEHMSRLNRAMNRGVARSIQGADAILWVAEALRFDERDARLQSLIGPGKPLVVAVNKIDRVRDKLSLLPFLQEIAGRLEPAAIVPVSAARGTAVATLLTVLAPLLPVGERMFGEDDITTLSERELAAELIREQLFRLFGEELPYACAVEIESFKASGGTRVIAASILVDKESQKPIVIGRRGEKMKRVASESRRSMEALLGGRVHLDVWVRTRSGWAEDERALKRLGFEVDR
jgi:GTP-binding protein Era